jgi:hypothetical protein
LDLEKKKGRQENVDSEEDHSVLYQVVETPGFEYDKQMYASNAHLMDGATTKMISVLALFSARENLMYNNSR